MIYKMLVIMPPKPDSEKLTQIFEDAWFFAMRSAEREVRRAKLKREGKT